MTQFNACISLRFDRKREGEEKLCRGLIFMPLSVSVLACDASGEISLVAIGIKNSCTLLIRVSFALHVRVHDSQIKHFYFDF